MGAHQSLSAGVQHGEDGKIPRSTRSESLGHAGWTVCDTACELLTKESWTLVGGNLIASLSDNSGSTIIPSAEELISWMGKLRRARHYCVFREAPDHIKNSRDAVYAAVCGDANVLEYAPENYRHDRDIVMAAVKRESDIYKDIAEEFRADREVTLLAVRSNGKLLKHASEGLHRDRQLVSEAVKTDSSALLLHPHDCWDVDLFLTAIPKTRGFQFRSFMEHEKVKQILDKRDFMLEAVKKEPLVLQFASRSLKADKELVLQAVERQWQALQHASSELQSDEDIVSTALAQDAKALQFAAEDMKDRRDLVLEAVKRDPQVLSFASKRLRGDDVVSATAFSTHIAQQCKRLYLPCAPSFRSRSAAIN